MDATPLAEAAVLALGPLHEDVDGVGSQSPDVEGAIQMFIEMGVQCDVVDAAADISRYRLVVLPDGAEVDEALGAKLNDYVAGGGALIFSGTAARAADGSSFVLAEAPVRYREAAPTTPSYLRPTGIAPTPGSELADDYDYAFYDQAHVVEPLPGAIAYGDLRRAYFSRTWATFMGHQHAPVDRSLNAPIAVRRGKVLYLAAPLFSGYKKWDYWAYRAIVEALLPDLLPDRLLYPHAPGWVECSLHAQPATAEHPPRTILHLIAYQARRTLQQIPHVDQAWTVADLSVRVRCAQPPARVYLAPNGKDVPYTREGDYVTVTLPKLTTYAVVVIEG